MNKHTTAILAIAASLLATAGDAGADTPTGQIFEPVNPITAGQFQRLEFFMVALDAEGRIRVDCANRTSVPGIFAAGDVASGYAEQVLIAVGEGAKAALSAYEYLLPNM